MAQFEFQEWPFSNVPTKERAVSVWADRKVANDQIEAILDDWLNAGGHPTGITLLWADLGAGKTHTLWNLESRCAAHPQLVPFYVLLPATLTNFLGLYKAISRSLPWNLIQDLIPSDEDSSWITDDVRQALKWRHNSFDSLRRALAERWLQGDKLKPKECQTLNVSGPISDTNAAVAVLSIAVRALAGSEKRVVLMIDEYQRVAEGNRNQRLDIGHGIHTLYNDCPRLSTVLSCATGDSDDYNLVLTDEVVSRLSPKRIDLPYLSADDIVDYIRDLFRHYRDMAAKVDPYFPLDEHVVRDLASFLVKGCLQEVTPRRVNEAFHELLSYMRREQVSTPITHKQYEAWRDSQGGSLLTTLMT